MRCAAIFVLLVLSCAIFAADAKNKKKKNKKKKPKPAPRPVSIPAPVSAAPSAPVKPPKGVCISPESDQINKMLMSYLKRDRENATLAKAYCMLAKMAPMSVEYKDFFALKVITHRYGPHSPTASLDYYVKEFVNANAATIRTYNAIDEKSDMQLPFGCNLDLQNKAKQEVKVRRGKRGRKIKQKYIVRWVEGTVNCLFLTAESISEVYFYMNLLGNPDRRPGDLNRFFQKLQNP
ncbi:unnamed protein product [Cylicocyclus nassatus]|uniref:Uncharacterized protein n=1 Tax=Cylicocyclus nassatus TaxID=53992 RepID=A0AA36DSB0_CYLNA|nr:unnamed protein product [Cylicocyclus nassatus]